jgi:non-specific serine/threonine protein kinase
LQLCQDVGSLPGVAESLEGIAALAAAQQQPSPAIQLAGAAASIRDGSGSPLTPMRRMMLDRWLVPLQQTVSQDTFCLNWQAGRAMCLDQALELALAVAHGPPAQVDGPSDESRKRTTQLSPREEQVAALLADGLTNRQIAEQLVVTERTVAAHIEHILDKLGFASRHQVATWADDNGLRT